MNIRTQYKLYAEFLLQVQQSRAQLQQVRSKVDSIELAIAEVQGIVEELLVERPHFEACLKWEVEVEAKEEEWVELQVQKMGK